MSDERESYSPTQRPWRQHATSSVVAAIVSVAGAFGVLKIEPILFEPKPAPKYQPNPHTSEDMREALKLLRQMEEARIKALDERLKIVEQSQGDMWRSLATLPPPRWRRRIEALEIEAIKKNPGYEVPQ